MALNPQKDGFSWNVIYIKMIFVNRVIVKAKSR